MKTVPLYGKKAAGRVALVDDDDYELVMRYRWRVWEKPHGPGQRTQPYAATNPRINGRKTYLPMHRLITGYAQTDHINHDSLDNQRSNLRPATTQQNAQNQRSKIGSSSRYRGVSLFRRTGRWQVMFNGRYIGTFVCEEDAADAYDAAALETWGEYAYLNRAERVS